MACFGTSAWLLDVAAWLVSYSWACVPHVAFARVLPWICWSFHAVPFCLCLGGLMMGGPQAAYPHKHRINWHVWNVCPNIGHRSLLVTCGGAGSSAAVGASDTSQCHFSVNTITKCYMICFEMSNPCSWSWSHTHNTRWFLVQAPGKAIFWLIFYLRLVHSQLVHLYRSHMYYYSCYWPLWMIYRTNIC